MQPDANERKWCVGSGGAGGEAAGGGEAAAAAAAAAGGEKAVAAAAGEWTLCFICRPQANRKLRYVTPENGCLERGWREADEGKGDKRKRSDRENEAGESERSGGENVGSGGTSASGSVGEARRRCLLESKILV
ncbi:unnamed protein product [Pleuronectes platessa]|uniref:Uncharacterized protein n=1 Tax=Pleuronectes platessa TaxID=8262 RepID=A0A9N7U0U7_PLEPL|nr:unnamed protein product [Pleuronectes platessa]